ncbi:hypothetical protein MCEMSEM23_01020 [Rhabdaerophilaceae bacterium]
MNLPLAFAGFLTTLLGVVHSISGELRTFPKVVALRERAGEPAFSDWEIRVLRGTWHTLSLFGFGLGFVLFVMAFPAFGAVVKISQAISISTLVVGAYWAYVTNLWHPAWIVFMLVSALCWWS